MQYIIDRLEGTLAICEGEDGSMVPVERHLLPQSVREGSVLHRSAEGLWRIDEAAEQERRARLHRLQDSLFQ